MGILKYVLHFKKCTWCSLLPNIRSCFSHKKEKFFFDMCSKTSRWVVRRCLSVAFNNAQCGWCEPSEGPGLGHAHWGKPSYQTRQASESSGWNCTFVPESIFSCLVGYHPSRCVHQGLARNLPSGSLYIIWSLIHYSSVGCFSRERTPNSYTFFPTLFFHCYFVDSFQLDYFLTKTQLCIWKI